MIGYVSHVQDSLHAQHLQAKALILILNCLAQTSVLAESLLGGRSYINILNSRDQVIKHTDVQFHLGMEAWTKHGQETQRGLLVKVIILSLFGGSL